MKPAAQGKHIYLRNVMPNDFDFLYSIRDNFDELHLWCNEREYVSCEEYKKQIDQQLRHTFRHFMMIATIDQGEKIGMIYCYNSHAGDGYAYTTIYLLPEWRNTICATEAGLLYYNYLFRMFNYRKLYCEVYDYNTRSMNFIQAAGFHKEGQLLKHRYYNGSFADLHIFAVYQQEFLQRNRNLLNLVTRSDF